MQNFNKCLEHYPEGWEFRPRGRRSTKLTYGFGVNDAPYQVKPIVNGKRLVCPYYRKWHNMLRRCYSKGLPLEEPILYWLLRLP